MHQRIHLARSRFKPLPTRQRVYYRVRFYRPTFRWFVAGCLVGILGLLFPADTVGAIPQDLPNDTEYQSRILPLLRRYCHDCHSADLKEADIDLAAFETVDVMRQQTDVWQKVRKMLASRQMPPKGADQPKEEELERLDAWVQAWLRHEAEQDAGDPGPVLLRRLNNEEYRFTVRDLTGLPSLDPAREFPVDGAAGEGFINTGSAQAMSPSLITKYMDAAKEIASHAVLQPDGITFSSGLSRREWTDERVQRIRNFYARFTEARDFGINVDGAGTVRSQGGSIPLTRYFAATLKHRDELRDGRTSVEQLAANYSINANYLGLLWQTLNDSPGAVRTPLIDDLRDAWIQASPDEIDRLVEFVHQVQDNAWQFNPVGQLMADGRQKTWMTPKSLVTTREEFRIRLPDPSERSEFEIFLSASDLGDGHDEDFVVWSEPRFVFPSNGSGTDVPPIMLREVPGLIASVERVRNRELRRTADYLNAIARLALSGDPQEERVASEQLDNELLDRWSQVVGIEVQSQVTVRGLYSTPLKHVGGLESLNGWGEPQTPTVLSNSSRDQIRLHTMVFPPESVTVHPSPNQESIVTWRSPVEGRLKIRGLIADADAVCGNGAVWRVDWHSRSGTLTVAEGAIDNGGRQTFESAESLALREGDTLSLSINARDRDHTCDTTCIDLTVSEIDGDQRHWNLAEDVVDRILESNPLGDSFGNPEIWFFSTSQSEGTTTKVIPGSALARWKDAVLEARPFTEIESLSREVQRVVLAEDVMSLGAQDRQLHTLANDGMGALNWVRMARVEIDTDRSEMERSGESDLKFGFHPKGASVNRNDLCVQAPRTIALRLPLNLLAGSEFVVAAALHGSTAMDGSVQVQVSGNKPFAGKFSPTSPILVSETGTANARMERAISRFRDLFPPAVCYMQIIPVDEVVTLTLFFREDGHLQRLMLDEPEIAALNRLWDELLFVAEEPIALSVAMEQIYEFATQDRPDLVNAFGPMREPINDRARRFRERLVATEPDHVDAVIRFANQAWRRPLDGLEEDRLREFYTHLRDTELSHDQAIRLTLARILASPTFLYRLEEPVAGMPSADVSGIELASRLSYFLWSSMPDGELRQAAESGSILSEESTLNQTHRMLNDPRIRRLAIQFACQWLHFRDFDQNDDKNETLYPEFATLRSDMYEEAILFFEDMFRNDRSILEMIDSDHAFMNESLAQHYGIAGVGSPEWHRVEDVRRSGRGGVLAMAALLSSQSGASRTSPILRGNWVYETLLGERLPRPPAGVPQLPEQVPEGLTERELIERHSSDPACAGCHVKVDPFGFALEQYDAIGRHRPVKVDTHAVLEDGTAIEGLEGLKQYIATTRRDDFVRQFCRKLLGYALGRQVQLSDEPLLDQMQADLKANDFRFHVAVEAIVTSRQFRQIRGIDSIEDHAMDEQP